MSDQEEDDDFFEEWDVAEDWPTLPLVKRFLKGLTRVNWLANVGAGLSEETTETARHYLDALGFPDVESFPVADWEDAADAAANVGVDSPAWEAEEQLRISLATSAAEILGEDVIEILLTHVSALIGKTVRATTEETAAMWDVEDEGLMTAVAGDIIRSAHQVVLLLAIGSDEEDHAFALKFRLFEQGHWPIGVSGNTFHIF